MNGKVILSVSLFIIWGLFSGWYYVCNIKQVCKGENSGVVDQGASNPITFTLGSSEPQEVNGFDAFKLELLNKLGESNILRITGRYSLDETTDADNLGLERAAAVRKLFPELSDDRFVFTSELIFNNGDSKSASQLKFDVLINNAIIEHTDFGSVVYYTAIDSFENNTSVLEFATNLANDTRISSIDIMGHTDDALSEADSYAKSIEVANGLKEVLIQQGMDKEKIFITGKGSSFPLADNITEEGRMKNNRIEVLINY